MSAGWIWEVRDGAGAWRTVKAGEARELIECGYCNAGRYARYCRIEHVVSQMRETERPLPVYGPDGEVWLVQCTQRLHTQPKRRAKA